jgi:hypothetical protein
VKPLLVSLVLLGGAVAMNDHQATLAARKQHAVVLITRENCAPCRMLERDLLPALRDSGLLHDSALIVVSANEEPELARRLMGGKMNQSRGLPQLVIFRRINGDGWRWRWFGYRGGRASLIAWLKKVETWRPRNPPAR